jgi:hypothetical protein
MRDLQQQFDDYHSSNPEVYELFKKFTFSAIAAGRQVFSVATIIERIRWEADVIIDRTDEFKINNNHKPFYARKFMDDYPEHAGFFRTRSQHYH